MSLFSSGIEYFSPLHVLSAQVIGIHEPRQTSFVSGAANCNCPVHNTASPCIQLTRPFGTKRSGSADGDNNDKSDMQPPGALKSNTNSGYRARESPNFPICTNLPPLRSFRSLLSFPCMLSFEAKSKRPSHLQTKYESDETHI